MTQRYPAVVVTARSTVISSHWSDQDHATQCPSEYDPVNRRIARNCHHSLSLTIFFTPNVHDINQAREIDMTSILTNQSAMSALSSLSATQRSLQTAQGQVSSGLRVSGASDNAAYWSISTAMKSQVAALSAVNDGLALTKSIADVTASALQGVIGIVQSIEKDVVSAQQPGVDVNAVQQSIIGLQNQIKSIVESASFNGVNWLVDDKPYQITENFVSNYTNSSSKADYDNLNSLDVAPYAETDNYDQNLQENIQVTSPTGTVSTFSENSDTSYIFSKASGSSVSNAANVAFFRYPGEQYRRLHPSG